MPKDNEVVLDEYEAKVYDHIMLFQKDPNEFARILISTQKDISRGNLLVRKDLIRLIVESLPENEKNELLDSVYELRIDTMAQIGANIMYGKKFRDTEALGG